MVVIEMFGYCYGYVLLVFLKLMFVLVYSGRNIKFLNLGFYDVKFYYWFFKERFY